MFDVKDIGFALENFTMTGRRSLAIPIIFPSGNSSVSGTWEVSVGKR